VITGFYCGISGVFLNPYKEAKEGGIIGLGKGLYSGLSGLIIKPVDGIIGGFSAIAEGATNTLRIFDDKPNCNRIRPPRVFYGLENIYMDYIDLDAEMKNVV